jgi:hypothetical protein
MNAPLAPFQRRLLLAALSLALSGLLLLFHVTVVRTSCIANAAEMGYELGCRDDNQASCIDEWMREQRTPYKYRILGRAPVWAAYEVLRRGGIEPKHAALYAFAAFLLLFMAGTLFLLGELMWTLAQRSAIAGCSPAWPGRCSCRARRSCSSSNTRCGARPTTCSASA